MNTQHIFERFEKFSPFNEFGFGIYDVEISILTTNIDNIPIEITTSIGELYADWMRTCDICPANDAIIERMEVMAGEVEEVFETKDLVDFTFEDLMSIIDDIWI
jgi:hypothetical protein